MSAVALNDGVWRGLVEDVVGIIDPERLSFCFDGRIDPQLCAELSGNGRLKDRLQRLVEAHYKLPPLPADFPGDERDAAIVSAPADTLAALVPKAGAIYWSAAIANTVLAADVAALHEQIGESLCAFAIKNRHLAGPDKIFPLPGMAKELIQESGWRCLAAWCESLDEAVGLRVRLKLPPNPLLDEPAPPELHEIGPQIVRRAASG